jgi:hypothetical protein
MLSVVGRACLQRKGSRLLRPRALLGTGLSHNAHGGSARADQRVWSTIDVTPSWPPTWTCAGKSDFAMPPKSDCAKSPRPTSRVSTRRCRGSSRGIPDSHLRSIRPVIPDTHLRSIFRCSLVPRRSRAPGHLEHTRGAWPTLPEGGCLTSLKRPGINQRFEASAVPAVAH